MEASAPVASHIEPEPPEWQPRALWVGARQLCGAASFFFVSFLFAYFYLRSLDVNKSWKIGSVNPSIGLGLAIMALMALSAVVFRLGSSRPADALGAGIAALLLGLVAVVLQFVEYTTLGFRTGKRRLRERVHRLDLDVCCVRDRVPVLDRDPGCRSLASAPRGAQASRP